MDIEIHSVGDSKIAEVTSADGFIIHTAQDSLNLLGNMYYQEVDKIILYAKNITPDFFELKNGLAGEVLQEFSNYRVRLAIVGDFSKYTSRSINDFMYESNKGKHIKFVATQADAFEVLLNDY